ALRSTGLVPAAALDGIKQVQIVLLAAGLFALGSGVRIAKLRTVGPRPFVLGLGSWVVIGLVSYIGVRLTHLA
ncbi:MAG: putative sulfate exporter family transporter, partial [Ilumatobacteraceae bacterium]